jgi:hypothetical protein
MIQIGQGCVGHGLVRAVEIQQQGDDGVGIGGKRQFHLPVRRQVTVAVDDPGQQFAENLHQRAPVVRTEIGGLLLQRLYFQAFTPYRFPHPGQVIPDQKIMQVLVVHIMHAIGIFQETARQIRQLPVGGKTIDHASAVGAQTGMQQIHTLLGRLRQAGFRQGRQQGVAYGFAIAQEGMHLCRVVGDLFQENGCEVHHGPCTRHRFQVGSHVGVVLDGVQVGPGQMVLAGQQVTILGLVHMPAQDHLQAFFNGHDATPGRAFPASPTPRRRG